MALVLATARSRMRGDAVIFCRPGLRQGDKFEIGAPRQFGINIDVENAYVPAIPVSLNCFAKLFNLLRFLHDISEVEPHSRFVLAPAILKFC